MAPKARNQPLRSHEQRNHRRHRPPTFISTIPVMVPPRGFGHRRRLRPPYQPIPQTEKVCGLRFSTRKGLGGQPPRGYSSQTGIKIEVILTVKGQYTEITMYHL